MKDVIRKTLEAGTETTFEMRLKRSQFMVKNFTNGFIKVRLGDNVNDSMIGPSSWERVFNNIDNVGGRVIPIVTDVLHITSDAGGIVEVVSIDD